MTDDNLALNCLAALGDPTRRIIFDRVATSPSTVGEIARGLPVSRPAVSQHLKVLKEAGLVIDEPDGARRLYRIDPKGLYAMRAWLELRWASAFGLKRTTLEQSAALPHAPFAYRLCWDHNSD